MCSAMVASLACLGWESWWQCWCADRLESMDVAYIEAGVELAEAWRERVVLHGKRGRNHAWGMREAGAHARENYAREAIGH